MRRAVGILLTLWLLGASLPGWAEPPPPVPPGSRRVAESLALGMPWTAKREFAVLPALQQGKSPLLPLLLRRLSEAGLPDEALSLFEELRPRLEEPARSETFFAVGEIRWELGDRKAACQLFREVSGRSNAASEARLYEGRCLASEGKFAEAVRLFSAGGPGGRGGLLAGVAEMGRNNRAAALSAWSSPGENSPSGHPARLLALSQGGKSEESVRALRKISLDPGSPLPEAAASLETLSSLLLGGEDPAGALAAAREGLRMAERWRQKAEEAGRWDGTGPGTRNSWATLTALFPYGEEVTPFRRAGRLFLSRSALAEGALVLENRARESARRIRGAKEALARSRESTDRAILRSGEIRGLYRGLAERAAAMRGRLQQAADGLVLSEWGAMIDPENAALLEVADRRLGILRKRLSGITTVYNAKNRKEWSPPLPPEDRLMVLSAQLRLERISRTLSGLEARVAFGRRAVWNRWKAAYASRATALLDRSEAIAPKTGEWDARTSRIISRLREANAAQDEWILLLNREEERLSARQTVLAGRREEAQAAAERARANALQELLSAISRRERSMRYLAARAATGILIAGGGEAARKPAAPGNDREALLAEALRHWESLLSAPAESGFPVDEALYAIAELRYEQEDRRFYGQPEGRSGLPDHDRSLSLFRRVVREHRESPYREAAYYGMALCLQETGKPDESASALAALLAEHPKTRYADEANLRLGEHAFDRYDFDLAAERYRKVGGDAPPELRATAQFKLGWSLFLRERPSEAAGAFLSSLLLSREARKTGGVAGESLRMMARSLVEAGEESGAEELLASRGAAEHGPAMLLSIQAILDAQNRYLDAAGIADRFARAYPASPDRIQAEVASAESLRKANRMEESYRRKGNFYNAFGPGSRWQSEPGRTPGDIARGNLVSEEGLRVAAYHFHGRSRESPPGNRPYILESYDAYLSLFPSSTGAGEVAFQRGWLLFEDGRKQAAAAAFEAAADRYGGPRVEAARYMALQAAKDLAVPADPGSQAEVVRLARRYEEAFPEGGRVSLALLDRARAHVNLRAFREGADAAERAARGLPPGKDRLAALRLSGDARFELGEFGEAEKAFREVLASAQDEALAGEMRRWVGFSMFRRAEGIAGEAAAGLFTQVAREFPALEIAPVALFRSGVSLAEAGKEKEAISSFLAVESHPGNRSLALDATRRLAALYEKTGEPLPAAERYERLGATEETADGKRALLLRAADLFAGTNEARHRRNLLAVASLPGTPSGLRVSCLFRAAESAGREGAGEEADRLYGQTVAAQAAAPEVSSVIAGTANYRRGEYRFARYRAMAIHPPLEKTFAAKQAALETAAGFFLEAIRLGDGETVSASLHRLGEGFEEFRNSLLASPPPKGLSGEEREEYRFLLEEKAAPIEEKAVEAYRKNLRQAVAANLTTPWVRQSLDRLKALRPALFAKRWEYAFPVVTIPVFRGIVERKVR